MRYVDYFTFQNYGPQIDVNGYSSMVSACGTYRSWGYPDSKIMLSAPFQGTPGAGQGADIRAYRDIVSASRRSAGGAFSGFRQLQLWRRQG